MPFELQIIRATEFVRVGPQGRLDLATSKETLAALAQACRLRGLDRALLDLRALPVPAKPLFTAAQLIELVGTFHEVGFGPQQRLAVLYTRDPHRGARAFAALGRIRGWQVQSFQDFESALLWLSNTPAEKRPRAEGQPIPIRFDDSSKTAPQPAQKKAAPSHTFNPRLKRS